MSKVERLVSQYKNELKYAGPFYISHEGFGAAPLGQIDYPALSMAFAEWLDAREILPEIVGWSNKTGFCDADAAGYAAAFPANENGLAAALSELETAIWDEFCKESIWDECIYDSQMPDEG